MHFGQSKPTIISGFQCTFHFQQIMNQLVQNLILLRGILLNFFEAFCQLMKKAQSEWIILELPCYSSSSQAIAQKPGRTQLKCLGN